MGCNRASRPRVGTKKGYTADDNNAAERDGGSILAGSVWVASVAITPAKKPVAEPDQAGACVSTSSPDRHTQKSSKGVT